METSESGFRGCAVALRTVAVEEQGRRKHRLDDDDVAKIKLASDIKRSLFRTDSRGSNDAERGVAICMEELDVSWRNLESSLQRIPTTNPCHVPQSDSSFTPPTNGPDKEIPGAFGRSIEHIFDHSWRLELVKSTWLWIPKLAVLGEKGYPARQEEIRRWGWRARKLVRVKPLPPLIESFAEVTKSPAMSRDLGKQPRRGDYGGGVKRRFEDDRNC